MIFWDVKRLARELNDGKINEAAKAKYYLATLVFSTLYNGYLGYYIGSQIIYLSLVRTLLLIAVYCWGVFDVYCKSRALAGPSVLDNLGVLGFPAYIHSVIAFWTGLVVVYSIDPFLRLPDWLLVGLYELLALAMMVVFFRSISKGVASCIE